MSPLHALIAALLAVESFAGIHGPAPAVTTAPSPVALSRERPATPAGAAPAAGTGVDASTSGAAGPHTPPIVPPAPVSRTALPPSASGSQPRSDAGPPSAPVLPGTAGELLPRI